MATGFISSPWESCSAEIRARIEASSSYQVFEPGQHIYHAGETAEGVYWLQSGILLIYNIKQDGSHICALPCYRGLYGTPAVLAGSYRAHLKAARASSVRFTPAATLTELLVDPAFGRLLGSYSGEDVSVMMTVWGGRRPSRVRKRSCWIFCTPFSSLPQCPVKRRPNPCPGPSTLPRWRTGFRFQDRISPS